MARDKRFHSLRKVYVCFQCADPTGVNRLSKQARLSLSQVAHLALDHSERLGKAAGMFRQVR